MFNLWAYRTYAEFVVMSLDPCYRKDEGGRSQDCMPKNKVHLYVALFNKVKEMKGGHVQAVAYLGLGGGTIGDAKKEQRLTVHFAKKILSGYQDLVKWRK